LRKVGNRQTDRQTDNNDDYISSLAEVTNAYKSSAVAEMGDRGHNSVGCHSSA